MQTDIRVKAVQPFFVQAKARTPLKFGAVVMDQVPLCYVKMTVENGRGRVAEGWGAMLLADMWGWPSPAVPHPRRSEAMIETVRRLCRLFEQYTGAGHPVDIYYDLQTHLQPVADAVTSGMGLAENMPHLNMLVCASPIDAAMHDAFGLVNDCSTWEAYGRRFCRHDLSRRLGPRFAGKYLADVIRPMPAAVPAFHLVGGLDKLRASEIDPSDPDDGLPVSLDQWMSYERLHCLKIKLKGADLDWDLQRIIEVTDIAHEEHEKLGLSELHFSADTNEQCRHPDYIVEMLGKLKERSPRAFEELLYVEQPTERDLRAHRWDVRPIARLKPVIIDESLASLEDFDLAMELGWSGVALKACKCQSAALVTAAKAEAMRIPYTIQDLTNPGLALVQSVALAAHLAPMMGVEANSRQFFPAYNDFMSAVHPGVCRFTDGKIDTTTLRGSGLGYQVSKLDLSFLEQAES